MTIIKKKSPEVDAMRRVRSRQDSVTINRQQLYFSKSFIVGNKFKAGQYVSFINDGDDWRFFVSDDADGFVLKPESRGRKGVYIQDGGLVGLIRKSTGVPAGKLTFPIEKTFTTQNGNTVYWVMTKKRIV